MPGVILEGVSGNCTYKSGSVNLVASIHRVAYKEATTMYDATVFGDGRWKKRRPGMSEWSASIDGRIKSDQNLDWTGVQGSFVFNLYDSSEVSLSEADVTITGTGWFASFSVTSDKNGEIEFTAEIEGEGAPVRSGVTASPTYAYPT